MSAAEPWPTEDAATKAVDTIARAAYDARRTEDMPTFDDLPVNERLNLRSAVLPLVWKVIEALPDPRHAAWEEGHSAAFGHGAFLCSCENPYPSGL